MAKDGDLWDDSALLNAFDDAISKYKRMHGKGQHDSSKERGKILGGTEESLPTLVDKNHEAKRHVLEDVNSNDESTTTTELGDANKLAGHKKDDVMDSFAQESNVDLSSGQHAKDALQEDANTQGVGDYNQLLNQYYELEEQRQKILQQLQQFGGWDYQGSSAQWGTCSASQEHPIPTNQASYPAVVSSCCPYGGQCWVAPCSFGETCVGNSCNATSGMVHNEASPFEDGDIIKTAMGAAERALSSLKTKTSETGKEKQEGQLKQSATDDADLTAVFNAWYSAGFYTGKYLTEQSIAKKWHG